MDLFGMFKRKSTEKRFHDSPSSKPPQRLLVDEEHYCYDRKDGTKAHQYKILHARSLILDLGSYEFDVASEWGWKQPTLATFMTMDQGEISVTLTPGTTEYEVVAPQGFASGEQIMLMIGRPSQVCWMTLINVV